MRLRSVGAESLTGRVLACFCLLLAAFPDGAEAGRRDDRDWRQSLRAQSRFDRDDRREPLKPDNKSPAQTAMPPKGTDVPSASAPRDQDKASGDSRGPAADGSRRNGTGSQRGDGIKDDDGDGAPDTIADLFKSWNKGSAAPLQPPKSAPPPAAASPVLAKPAAKAVPAAVAVGATAVAPSKGWGGKIVPAGQGAGSTLDLPQLPIRRGELLAANLTPRAVARARELGYVVAPAESLPNLGMVLSRLVLPPGADPVQALELMKPMSGSSLLAFNTIYRPIRAATDDGAPTPTPALPGKGCAAGRCYGPQTIKWQPQLSSCARRVRVGVIDTGIDAAHSTFKRRIHVGNVQQGTRPAKGVAHGTGVLAIMAGDPESATPGLIPEADFFAIDIFYADATGAPVSDTAHLLRALDMLEAWDVKVINLSLTGPRDDLVAEAVQKLARKNVLMVAAAGNDGPAAEPAYPAGYPEVIAVTAVNRDQRAYRLASHGDYIDVAAPGVDIWTALPNEKQGNLSGTSLATPFVSAVIAGLYESLPKKNKAAALAGLNYVDLGAPGRDRVFGNGLVIAPATCRPADVDVAQARKPSAPAVDAPSLWPAATKSARPASASSIGFAPD